MVKRVLLALAIGHLSLVIAAHGAVEIGGHYENDLIGVVKRTGGGMAGDLNRLRLKIDARPYENIGLHLEPEYQMLIKSEPLPLISDASALDRLNWDRAYIKINHPQADITIGKQRIAWGTGYIWNPTDVLNPFTLSFAVSEEDEQDDIAARVEIPLGEADGIDAFIVGGEKWENSIKAIKRKTNVYNYDWSVSYVDLGSNGFQFGFDMAGELFDLGARSEVALISPLGANRYFRSSWGLDYTFENGWYINTEYYFNGAGDKKKNMDYFYFGMRKNLDELTAVNLSIILNADDMSHLVYPSISYNMWQNADVSLEALFPGGMSGSEYMPTSQTDPSGYLGSRMVFLKYKYSF